MHRIVQQLLIVLQPVSAHSGFYVDRDIKDWGSTGHPRICMLTKVARDNAGAVEMYRVRRPNNQWLRLELTRREVSTALICSVVPVSGLLRCLWSRCRQT